MEDDACGEYVADGFAFGAHVADVDYFGGHEAWGAATHEQVLLLVCVGGQSEIADRHLPAAIPSEHHILRFQIPMNYPISAQMSQPLQQILNDHFGLFRVKLQPSLNLLKATLRRSLSCIPCRCSKMT